MAIRGIKSKIALNVVLLVLLSAIITDVLMIVLIQSLQVREQVTHCRKLLDGVGHLIIASDGDREQPLNAGQKDAIVNLIRQTAITALHIGDEHGRPVLEINHKNKALELSGKGGDRPPIPGQVQIVELGLRWAGFWWHPEAVKITLPVISAGRPKLQIAAIVSLTPIYDKLRQYNKPILFYIAINAAILTLVGLYRIFRIYLKPIDRIIRQADDYQEDGDLFFAFRQEDNELNRLSISLNRMLLRIKDDKEILQTTISSLEQANTDLKSAQNDVLRAEKMASVGRLAAGIAHEIGNPIGIVLGYLEMLKQDDLDAHDKVDFLKRTEDEIQRINTIIRQLLDLARPKDTQTQAVALHPLIEDITDVLGMQPLMSSIEIKLELDADHDTVWANADQLRQVFLNLLINAGDAIAMRPDSESGVVRVRSLCVEAPDTNASRCIQIQFTDNGVGMSTEQIDNIFDPFYSTKDPGKGTGLGLAVSFMIVERVGGTINAASEPGNGSTLTVEIPLLQESETIANHT